MSDDDSKNPMLNEDGKYTMPKEDGENTKPDDSSSKIGQPSSSPWTTNNSGVAIGYKFIYKLFYVMTCPSRYNEFLGFLAKLDTYEADERESMYSTLGTLLIFALKTSHFLYLATNQSGSRALGTLLKRKPSLGIDVISSVDLNFPVLMYSEYGRCLVVSTVRAVGEPLNEQLFELTYDHALSLATHANGCVALIEVFQEIKGSEFRDLIFRLIALNAWWLCFDLCGIQVVQNFLSLQDPSTTKTIAKNLFGSYFELAKERQGSYVVETCLKSQFGREIVLAEFRGNDKEWVRMANHVFGNSVAQCALREMKERGMTEMLSEFVEKLRPHFEEMKIGYGNNTLRVIEEIEESTEQLPVNILGFLT